VSLSELQAEPPSRVKIGQAGQPGVFVGVIGEGDCDRSHRWCPATSRWQSRRRRRFGSVAKHIDRMAILATPATVGRSANRRAPFSRLGIVTMREMAAPGGQSLYTKLSSAVLNADHRG